MLQDAKRQGKRVEPRFVSSSARDMKTTGADVPRKTPPNLQSAVYMIALTVRLAESRFGKSMMSAAPTTDPSTCFFAPASAA